MDHICPPCKVREKAHPAFAAADAAEIAAVRACVPNFQGLGCPAELLTPPCFAEQFAIDAARIPPNDVRRLAQSIAVFEGADDSQHDHYVFADGSAVKMVAMAPVSITITQFPAG